MNKEALRKVTGDEIEKALSYVARVAGVTVSRAGANPPTLLPWQNLANREIGLEPFFSDSEITVAKGFAHWCEY